MSKFLRKFGILLLGVLVGVFISNLSRSYFRHRITKLFQLTSKRQTYSEFDVQAYLKQFPAPREGFKRYIIPAPKDEPGKFLLVDILVGKYRVADCNSPSFSLIKSELKSDWTGSSYRYYYYEIETGGEGLISTLIGCQSVLKFDIATNKDIPKNLSFERMMNNEYYPIVVDVNYDFEIGYRLWSSNNVVGRAELVK